MVDLIVLAVILLILGGAVFYIIKEKKKGARCVGCSMAGQCSGKCQSARSNHTEE